MFISQDQLVIQEFIGHRSMPNNAGDQDQYMCELSFMSRFRGVVHRTTRGTWALISSQESPLRGP